MNAEKVLDFYPGTVTRARGIFVLYEILGNWRIMFMSCSGDRHASVSCPEGILPTPWKTVIGLGEATLTADLRRHPLNDFHECKWKRRSDNCW